MENTRFFNIILLVLSMASFSSTDAATLIAGDQYKGGSMINSPWTGVSFRIPPGFIASYDNQTGAMVVSNNADVTLAVYGASEGDLETVGELVVEAVKELGIKLSTQQVTRPDTKTLNATFSAWVNNQPRSMLGTVRKGPYNNVISIMGLGMSGQEQKVQNTIQSIAATLQWKQPTAQNQRHRLAGKSLYRSSGSSDGSSGPGGFTASTSHKTQIDFCSNGQYGYQSVTESYVSTSGASMPHKSSSGHQGLWWLVADLGGSFYLYLESNQNKYYMWQVSETNNGANVDGANYSVSQSSLCS